MVLRSMPTNFAACRVLTHFTAPHMLHLGSYFLPVSTRAVTNCGNSASYDLVASHEATWLKTNSTALSEAKSDTAAKNASAVPSGLRGRPGPMDSGGERGRQDAEGRAHATASGPSGRHPAAPDDSVSPPSVAKAEERPMDRDTARQPSSAAQHSGHARHARNSG